jgi:uncharacterized protein involved in exopolysaccharide biosynthesis
VVEELERNIAGYEVDLAGLRKTHKETHPEIQALHAKIERARTRIEGAEQQVHASDTSILNPIYQEVERERLSHRAQRDALRARLTALEHSVERYQGEVARLVSHKSELARLSLEVDILEDSYKLVSRDYQEAKLAAAQAITEIRVLHHAVPPLYPSSPIKGYYGGGGLALGCLLAVGWLLLRDYADDRVRSREEVEELLGIPVLATLPHAEVSDRALSLIASTDEEGYGQPPLHLVSGGPLERKDR